MSSLSSAGAEEQVLVKEEPLVDDWEGQDQEINTWAKDLEQDEEQNTLARDAEISNDDPLASAEESADASADEANEAIEANGVRILPGPLIGKL